MFAEVACEEVDGFACGDGQKDRFGAHQRFIGVNQIGQDLWLDGKQDNLRNEVFANVVNIGNAIDAVLRFELFSRFALFNDKDVRCLKPAGQPAFEHGTAHLATANQQKTRIHKFCSALSIGFG